MINVNDSICISRRTVRIVVGAVALAAVAGLVLQLPEIARYVKSERM